MFRTKEMSMRYHFNIRDAAGLISDDEGSEFADLNAARAEARASARDLAVDDLRCGVPVHPWRIEIADDDGMVLDSIHVTVTLN
jgi:hypothetical protein